VVRHGNGGRAVHAAQDVRRVDAVGQVIIIGEVKRRHPTVGRRQARQQDDREEPQEPIATPRGKLKYAHRYSPFSKDASYIDKHVSQMEEYIFSKKRCVPGWSRVGRIGLSRSVYPASRQSSSRSSFPKVSRHSCNTRSTVRFERCVFR